MAEYLRKSAQIYKVYLRYISPEDIHVYSIDEVFIDVTSYLRSYGVTPHELALRLYATCWLLPASLLRRNRHEYVPV